MNAADEFIAEDNDVDADIVADRFHVAKQYRDCVDTVRKKECKRLRSELDESTYTEVTYRIHWVLRRNEAALNDDEKQRLKTLFKHAPDLQQAYRMREALTDIFN